MTQGASCLCPSPPVHSDTSLYNLVAVHSLILHRSAEDPQGVDFVVSCSKGTYVRSLAADLAAHMGTVAHLTALRRLSSGEHDVAAAWQLPDLISQLGNLKKEDAAQA